MFPKFGAKKAMKGLLPEGDLVPRGKRRLRQMESVTATDVEIRQGGARNIQAEQVVVRQGGIVKAQAKNIAVNQGGVVGAFGDRVQVGPASGSVFSLARSLLFRQSYAQVAVVRDSATMDQSAAALLIAGNVKLDQSAVGILFAKNVEGNVSPLVDTRGALIIGVMALTGLVTFLLIRESRRS